MRLPARYLAAALLGFAVPLSAQGTPDAEDPVYRLRNVVIGTRNVFTDDEAEGNLLYRLANWFHFPTHTEVVRRELWFGEGDTVSADEIEELERNLRRFGLFGEVTAEVRELGPETDEVDLVIDTRDRFSLIASGSISSVGGVTKYDVAVGETNLFGTGKRLSFAFSQADEERNTTVRYTDPQLLGSWHQLTLTAGETEQGPYGSIDLRRPFQYLADPISYGAFVSGADRLVDYYAMGQTVASVPEERFDVRAFATHAWGPRHVRRRIGLELAARRSDYERAFGPAAPTVRVPGDTVELQAGPTVGLAWLDSVHKVTGLDTLDFVQDLELGLWGTLRPALVLREEDGHGSEVQGQLGGSLRAGASPWAETYLSTEVGGDARWAAGDTRGWRFGAALHAYQTSLPLQTLAASFRFDGAFETQDLQPQFTLGEDNGLRGYPARQFAGSRVALLNLEDRIRTGLELWSFELGLVAFFDAGWVHNPGTGLSMSDAIKSAGAGLRIGSSHFLGGSVFRIDVGWPLDEVTGQEFDVSLSFATGQVFTFFGNASALRTQF